MAVACIPPWILIFLLQKICLSFGMLLYNGNTFDTKYKGIWKVWINQNVNSLMFLNVQILCIASDAVI